MISYLELTNYRGFKEYRLSGLRQVNLLVGKNNSGKTSILEAVNLLAAGGDPRVVSRIARQRGELMNDTEEGETRTGTYADLSHFFHGHEFIEESNFIMKADGDLGTLQFSVVHSEEPNEVGQKVVFDGGGLRTALGLSIRLVHEGRRIPRLVPTLPVSENGALLIDQTSQFFRMFRPGAEDGVVQFVSQDSLERASMAQMWDRVQRDGKEPDVVNALKILDERITSVAFLTGERPFRYGSRGGILLGFEGSQRRLPLGSNGEGMRRLLALALSLVNARNGILLIDEIDTGLHYSIMGDMWRLVAQTAQRYNIQVFATTHSFDCVRGLDWLCRKHPDLGDDVSLQKIEPELAVGVALNAEQIKIAVEQDIEVR